MQAVAMTSFQEGLTYFFVYRRLRNNHDIFHVCGGGCGGCDRVGGICCWGEGGTATANKGKGKGPGNSKRRLQLQRASC